jgi:hypothetical protein
MALSKNIQTKTGLQIVEAYLRVEAISILEKTSLQFVLRKYADKNKPSIEESTMTCKYNLAGSNPIEQAYVYVKSLEEFSDAKDC